MIIKKQRNNLIKLKRNESIKQRKISKDKMTYSSTVKLKITQVNIADVVIFRRASYFK